MPITPSLAAAELLRRRYARRSLVEYAMAIDVPGAPIDDEDVDPTTVIDRGTQPLPLHIRVMLEAIERAVRKYRGRLIIMAPPGAAKSSYVSVVTPAWAMQLPGHRNSSYRVILASYAADLAEGQSRRARSLVQQDKHRAIFPRGALIKNQKAASDWKLENGAEYLARGFMSGITGNRADLMLIDDPLKNREQADSPTTIKKISDEYRESAKTRLKPGASIIIIMTSWSENDLLHGDILPEDYAGESGQIKCRDGQVWEVLNIPAEAEHADDPLGRKPGEFLWPEWFDEEHWLEFKNDPRAARTWSALYQQRPRPTEGIQFQRAKARWYDPDLPWTAARQPGAPGYGTEDNPCCPPRRVRNYGASDYATTDNGGDYTEHGLVGLDHYGNFIFSDWWSGQRETDVSIRAFNDLVARHRDDKNSAFPVNRWWNEGGTIDRAIGPAVRRSMREYPGATAYVTIDTLPSIADKEVKLLSFHARYNAGQVYFPIRRDWAQQVVDQLVKFGPGCKYDDKCDVCGLLGRGIDQMGVTALPSEKERRPGLKPFTAEWIEYEERKEPTVRYFS